MAIMNIKSKRINIKEIDSGNNKSCRNCNYRNGDFCLMASSTGRPIKISFTKICNLWVERISYDKYKNNLDNLKT